MRTDFEPEDIAMISKSVVILLRLELKTILAEILQPNDNILTPEELAENLKIKLSHV